jgi:c-di-GMP-binding flagellar brake protein YcgR
MNNLNQDYVGDFQSHLSINDILQVRAREDNNSVTYYSRVDDIVDGKLVIAWPTHGGIRLIVRRDQILDFSYTRDGIPSAFMGLIDETSVDPIPLLNIIVSSEIIHVQRRQNVRIKCLIPLEITASIKEHPQDEAESPLYIQTTTYDLSASGLSILHRKKLPERSLIEIKLRLPDDKPAIKAPCCIIYSEEFAKTTKLYRTGLRYLTISEAERARIVRFVYRTQLTHLNG